MRLPTQRNYLAFSLGCAGPGWFLGVARISLECTSQSPVPLNIACEYIFRFSTISIVHELFVLRASTCFVVWLQALWLCDRLIGGHWSFGFSWSCRVFRAICLDIFQPLSLLSSLIFVPEATGPLVLDSTPDFFAVFVRLTWISHL